MLASIHSGSSTKLWPEILRESGKHQCVLFIFPGGRLSSRDEYEYMRNGIFDLVNAKNFDGAISWSSSLSGFASEKQVEDFLISKIDIPLVTFGLKIGESPVVNIDTYAGMKQLVFHLAKRHKCVRIAYIGGPTAHSSAEDRYKAYRDALEESGIRFDEGLVSLDNSWTEGRKAMGVLLDERGLQPGRDFDALCTASDLLSFEAAKLLQERGVRIPADIALGGFNDSDESNLFSPTYTTVRMPFERQALQAFRMLLERLDGKKPADRILKTKLVIRQSCGCLTESVHMAGSLSSSRWKSMVEAPEAPTDEEILRFVSGASGFGAEESSRYLEPVVSSFLSCLAGSSRDLFIDRLDAVLNEFIFQNKEIGTFQDILSALRISCSAMAETRTSTGILETLIGQGRVLVSDAEKRISNYRAWKEKSLDHWLNILSHELLYAKNFEAIVKVAGRYLPELGIRSGYFVLNGKEPGRKIFVGGFDSPGNREESAKILDGKGGRRGFPSELLLPEELFSSERGAFIVLPLYFEATSLGYLILQAERSDAYIYEEVRAQISSAMRGVLLFEQVNEARKRAEKAEKMKTEFLAGISGELQEPSGFIYNTAARLLAEGGETHREDLEAIASFSARQMELTKHLLDLSLAQVGDFSLNQSLFDPQVFVERFAADAEAKQRKRKWGPVAPAPPPGALPLAWGDTARIRQVLEIFLDCLFRDLGAGEADVGVSVSPAGIGLAAGGRPGGAGAAEKTRELRSIMAASPGQVSLDRMRIEIELAKRIAFLHGGTIESAERGGVVSLELLLPYPSLEAIPSREISGRKDGAIGLLGGRLPAALGTLFPGRKVRSIGIADAGSASVLSEELSLLYIDPAAMSAEDAVAAGILLDHDAFRRTSCFVPTASLDDEVSAQGTSLGDFLLRSLPARSSRSVIIFGAGAHGDGEAADALAPLAGQDLRLLRCRSPEELGLIAGREAPRLLVLAGQRLDLLAAVASSPAFANVPLLCLAGRFGDAALEKALAERPRAILCNSGEVFGDLFFSIVERACGGEEEFLPAPTGSIIIKAVFFLNKYFREQVSRWKLSECVNASEDYLSRIFHRQMGIPLWEYLNRLRIGYAIELLKSSAESVSEIASRAGFRDQAYFCRVFRRITGATPGAVRKVSGSNVRKVQ